jgi:hypothetical protein
VTRRSAAFARAALAAPALAAPVLGIASPALAAGSPDPSPSSGSYQAAPSLPTLVPPVLPPLELSAFTSPSEPVAGQDYLIQVTVKNVGQSPAQHVRLSLRLSPDLTLASVPAACAEIDGIPAPALECEWQWLGSGGTETIPLVVRPLYGGYVVAVGSILRYDWGLWAYANVIRVVQCPAPAPSPPPPPPSPSPRPSPVLTTPPASPVPHPVRRVVKFVAPPPTPPAPPPSSAPPSPAPKPKAKAKAKPRPRPRPSSTAFAHIEELPVIPSSSNKPVIPLGVLITAVLTPCVAAAATRFGKR